MTNRYFCSGESKETFTEHQIIEISAAITKAVEDVIIKQFSALEMDGFELEKDLSRRFKKSVQSV